MFIMTNTAMALDGRISTGLPRHRRFGSREDLRQMKKLRKRADAVLLGGNSFRNWPYPLTADEAGPSRRKKPIWNVVLSRSMRVPVTKEFQSDKRIRPLFLTRRKKIPKNFPFEVLRAGGPITPRWIVQKLARRGIRRLLIDGGGALIYQFVKAGLVNEMNVTLCPKLIGRRGAPSLCDGAGFSRPEIRGLKLVSLRRRGDEIFLRYSPER